MELEDHELYICINNDEEFKEIVMDLLGTINDFYSEDVYNKYNQLLNVLNNLDVNNFSDDTINEINIIKQGINEYEQRCADFRLHKSIFEEAGLLK
jgi:hypothetical protein